MEVRYIEVLFHTFYHNFGQANENHSLNRGLRYKEVPQIEVPLYLSIVSTTNSTSNYFSSCFFFAY